MRVARVGGKGWGVHDADVVAVEQDLAGNEMNEEGGGGWKFEIWEGNFGGNEWVCECSGK